MIEFFQTALTNSPVMLAVMIAAPVAAIGLLVMRVKNRFTGSDFGNRTLELLIILASITGIIFVGLILQSNKEYNSANASPAPSTETSSTTSTSQPASTSATSTSTTQKREPDKDLPNAGTALTTLNITSSDGRIFSDRAVGLGDTLYPNSIRSYCVGYSCLSKERSIRFEIDDKYTKFSAVVGVKKDAEDIDQIGEFTLISHGPDGLGKELGRWTASYIDSPVETGTIDITGTRQLELRVKRIDNPSTSDFKAVDLAWGDPQVFP